MRDIQKNVHLLSCVRVGHQAAVKGLLVCTAQDLKARSVIPSGLV